MAKTCPGCGTKTSGKFCSSCGGSLDQSRACTGCGNTIPLGGRFCNMCGVPVAGAVPPGAAPPAAGSGIGPNVPWIVAGAALLALVVAVVAPRFTSSDAPQAAAPPITGPAAPTAGTPPDLSGMTPREAADRLFNRVMESVATGDTAQALAFAPMAISAYGMVDQIDTDGLYHLAVLQLVSSDPEAARETADRILAIVPEHLFGLFTAAQAETILGNDEAAGELYSRFLSSYDTELAEDRLEYSDHAQVLPSMRAEAEQRAG
ncbi:MAG: hypothetical protein WD766_03370 [Gemmatimonadota bacterium]